MSDRPNIPADVARSIFVEAGHRCACCGTAFPLERAHIVPWKAVKDHSAANLICLCANCHEMADKDWDRKTFYAYKSRPWVNRQAPIAETQNVSDARTFSLLSGSGPKTPLPRSPLRILYFQDQPRSAGLDCCNSTKLVDELRRRTHDVRLCWAVHPPAKNDWAHVNDDLIDPKTVRDWKPHALVFEAGLFRGEPRIPLELLDELESSGSVALIELDWHEIWNAYTNWNGHDGTRARLEAFFSSRELALLTADGPHAGEHPICKSRHERYLTLEADELRASSAIRDEELFLGVRRIAASAAVPLQWASGNLAAGGRGTYVKAYKSSCHEELNPQFGVLYDKRGHTEAIFTGNLIWDGADEVGDFDNHIYLTNLIEVLHRRRSQINQTGW
jgi:hypothetical protein